VRDRVARRPLHDLDVARVLGLAAVAPSDAMCHASRSPHTQVSAVISTCRHRSPAPRASTSVTIATTANAAVDPGQLVGVGVPAEAASASNSVTS
jgi:hypothetical protein